MIPSEAITDDGVERQASRPWSTSPADPQRPGAICEREPRREGFDLSEATDGEIVYLWWD